MLRKPHKAGGASLVLYPHGNLCLAINPSFITIKLNRNESQLDLINFIGEQWQTGGFTPLFVCEGQAGHKLTRIKSNTYLDRVFNQLCNLNTYDNQMVIYGWAMSDQDTHILDALSRKHINRIAVSVHNNDQAFCIRVRNLLTTRLSLTNNNIFFFHANSPGCWIHDNV